MLNTLTRFTSSFAALLSDENAPIDVSGRLEGIRYAMLDMLMELDTEHENGAQAIWASVGRASEVQTLWYLRSDLLRVLSGSFGEMVAREKVGEITGMFRGIVPKNQMPSAQGIKR